MRSCLSEALCDQMITAEFDTILELCEIDCYPIREINIPQL